VPALHQHRARTHRLDRLGRVLHQVARVDLETSESGSLGQVRRDEGGERQDPFAQRADRILV